VYVHRYAKCESLRGQYIIYIVTRSASSGGIHRQAESALSGGECIVRRSVHRYAESASLREECIVTRSASLREECIVTQSASLHGEYHYADNTSLYGVHGYAECIVFRKRLFLAYKINKLIYNTERCI
jgi:hypothetical protein